MGFRLLDAQATVLPMWDIAVNAGRSQRTDYEVKAPTRPPTGDYRKAHYADDAFLYFLVGRQHRYRMKKRALYLHIIKTLAG